MDQWVPIQFLNYMHLIEKKTNILEISIVIIFSLFTVMIQMQNVKMIKYKVKHTLVQ